MKSLIILKLLILTILITALFSGSAQARKTNEPLAPQKITSYRQLMRILKKHRPQNYYWERLRTTTADIAVAGGGIPYSGTNVQVEGVDEADIVKTDGKFIYPINGQRILIIPAYPESNESKWSVQNIITFDDENFYPIELFVDGNSLVVIGSAWDESPNARFAPIFSQNLVRTMVYDIEDKSNITLVREVEIEGDYISSRKIDRNLYLISRTYPQYSFRGNQIEISRKNAVPRYRDTAVGKRDRSLRLASMFYLEDFFEPDYLVIASFSLADSKSPAKIKAYLGAGELVYASRQNLYVSASRFFSGGMIPLSLVRPMVDVMTDVKDVSAADAEEPVEPEESTSIYKFGLEDGGVTFRAHGKVPGSVLNQFSMDEKDDFFRVATTTHGQWDNGENVNNVHVLGPNMQIVGQIEGLAPGEQIYSARFVGDRCYLVTFRNIDPLFVIDLATPDKPSILGELKIPGYSNYLHPYDENHLIGFGKDAVVVNDGEVEDPWLAGRAYYQGMKIALFDVTEVENPKELHSFKIGDRGTDSELLWNHKALLFDRNQNLLAFPITVAEITDPKPDTPPWQYGEYIFQGAYVLDIDLKTGFKLRGAITHLDQGDDFWNAYDQHIQRILYIGTNLYSLSNGMVTVNDIQTIGSKGVLDLP